MKNAISQTFLKLISLPSPSQKEKQVSDFIKVYLEKLGIETKTDAKGNLIAYVLGDGDPLMLNAHMDRTVPGTAVTPIIEGTIVKTDGTTNLGADDCAGITIILETVSHLITHTISHPPLVLVFTVEEELGLLGAKEVSLLEYKVTYGIVFDNAFEAGVVVKKGAAYITIDSSAQGISVHPGKNIEEGRSVLPILNRLSLPQGIYDNKQTRINWGKVSMGHMRNAVADRLTIEGEIRTFLTGDALKKRIEKIADVFRNLKLDVDYIEDTNLTVAIDQKARSYTVHDDNIWLNKYKEVLKKRKRPLILKDTFVASDANIFNEKGIETFVISTGVVNEHTNNELIDLRDIEMMTHDLIALLEK